METKVIKKSITDIYARCANPSVRLNLDYLIWQVILLNEVTKEEFKEEYSSIRNYILASRKLAVFSGKSGGVQLLPTGTQIYKGRVR